MLNESERYRVTTHGLIYIFQWQVQKNTFHVTALCRGGVA